MKVWVKTFGCRVNQYDGELLASRLSNGAERAADFESADLCVVNTCTVTQAADNEALRLLRLIARRNPAARLVVTGCLASRDPGLIQAAAPGALVVGNDGKQALPAALGCAAAPPELARFTGKSRAFLKIQDGCNMSCAFCIVPSVRPKLESRAWPEVEREALQLVGAGHEELVLCGVRLGRYLSRDASGARVDLAGALERLLARPGGFRLRLSSLEITDLTDRLIDLMAASGGRLCPSIHAPLQSGSDDVLKSMKRWYSAGFYARRVEALRAAMPRAAVFADVMCGFPGETERDHARTLELVESLALAGLHIFRYSARPGTPAAGLRGVKPQDLQRRAADLRALDLRLRARHAASAVGEERLVAVESDGLQGVSEDFLTVTLDRPLPAGLARVVVSSAAGPMAHGAASPRALAGFSPERYNLEIVDGRVPVLPDRRAGSPS